MRIILHVDFNSYFATVEQQANPRLRGKPIGVTGGDRMERTVVGAASIEAKKFGVKTGMHLFEARKLCPEIIFVPGDSDKYFETTKRFLNILKDYSPYLEVFSIDEAFLELPGTKARGDSSERSWRVAAASEVERGCTTRYGTGRTPSEVAKMIKSRIRSEIGEWITCSIGISYNKLMAKLAGSLKKPDGLIIIPDQKTAIEILDRVELDEICGIGFRIKKRLFNMGITNFKALRAVPKEALLASFKSYGETLYNMARGIDERPVVPFYEKAEVKSIGHRHTISHDTADIIEIKQILLKLTELIARKLRTKKLVGRTVSCWFRSSDFSSNGMQVTIQTTDDGLEIFKAAWKIFHQTWDPENLPAGRQVRMVGVSISNLKSVLPENLSLLPETSQKTTINKTLDLVNNKYGEFTLQRGILLQSAQIKRQPNPFLTDRRFKQLSL